MHKYILRMYSDSSLSVNYSVKIYFKQRFTVKPNSSLSSVPRCKLSLLEVLCAHLWVEQFTSSGLAAAVITKESLTTSLHKPINLTGPETPTLVGARSLKGENLINSE